MTLPPPPGPIPPSPVPPGPPGPVILPREALPTLPVEETDYVQFFRSPRYRWWKSLVGIAAVGLAWLAAMLVVGIIGFVLDGGATGFAADGTMVIGPWTFLANNVAIAVGIPLALFASWLILGQRPRWLTSVVGGMRWGWFGRVCLVILPLWVVIHGVSWVMEPPADLGWKPYSLLLIVGVLLTTPFQAAGEEYLLRGFLARAVGAWIRPELPAFIVSAVVSSIAFMLLHGAGDAWLNVFYFVFGACAAWLTWRTGGLEAAIALHVINNMLSEVSLPFTDFSEMFNREAGVGDATMLLPMGALVVVTAIIDWYARRRGVVRRSAPGRPALEAALAQYRSWTPYPRAPQYPTTGQHPVAPQYPAASPQPAAPPDPREGPPAP